MVIVDARVDDFDSRVEIDYSRVDSNHARVEIDYPRVDNDHSGVDDDHWRVDIGDSRKHVHRPATRPIHI